MTEISKKEFLTCVSKSRVVELELLKKWIVKNPASDANELAACLVRDQLITRWQAKYLMTGRSRLDIGNYRLLERIQRDELGDRFLAIHKQLGRKVDIQVLPANLTDDKQRCEAFIKKASETAKLDHRHLKHVYDIDQEGGRYFLVTEHCDGVTLAQTRREGLSLLGLARIVDQAVVGLEFAREYNVTHGNLSQQDLLISDEDGIKVQNLAISPLRLSGPPTSNTQDHECDLRALGKIGLTVLGEIAPDGETDVDGLQNVFQTLMSTDPATQSAARHQLSNWLASHDYESSEETFESISFEQGEIDFAESIAAARKGRFEPLVAQRPDRRSDSDVQQAGAAPNGTVEEIYNDVDEDEYDDEYDDRPQTRFLTRMVSENPVGLVATALVIGLMLLAGLGSGLYSFFGKKTTPIHALATSGFDSNQTLAATSESNSEETSGISLDDLDSIGRLVEKLSPEPQENNPETALVASPADGGKPEVPPGDIAISENPASDEPLPETASEPTSVTDPGETTVLEVPEPKPPLPIKVNHFEDFPEAVSLPSLNDTHEKKIADLVLEERFLLGAEVFMHPKIAKAKMLIEMDRATDDNQKWIVTTRRNERNKPEPIATFRKSESELFFQWLPEAEKNRYAGYLQNCLLKLEVSNKSTWLKLREPVLLDPMTLKAESMSAEINADLKYLPDPEIIAIEILPTRIPETKLQPAQLDLEQHIPGRIMLSNDDDEPFVWIQVSVDLKQRLRARTDLVVLYQASIQPLKNMLALDEVAAAAKQNETVLYAKHEAAVNTPAQPGQGEAADRIRAQLAKALKDAQAITAKAIEYKSLAAKTLNQPIGIRVFAKMDGREIELARTKDVAE